MPELKPGSSIVVFTGDAFSSPTQHATVTSVGLPPDGKDWPVSVNCTVEPEGAAAYDLTSVHVYPTKPDEVGTQTGWLA